VTVFVTSRVEAGLPTAIVIGSVELQVPPLTGGIRQVADAVAQHGRSMRRHAGHAMQDEGCSAGSSVTWYRNPHGDAARDHPAASLAVQTPLRGQASVAPVCAPSEALPAPAWSVATIAVRILVASWVIRVCGAVTASVLVLSDEAMVAGAVMTTGRYAVRCQAWAWSGVTAPVMR
jgi:hypothetical protein